MNTQMSAGTLVPLITIVSITLLFIFIYYWARKKEAKMRSDYFIIKQIFIYPIVFCVFIGLGLFVNLIILIDNIEKGNTLIGLNENDAFGVMMGTIFIVIGVFLVYIVMRWRMFVSPETIVYTPFFGRTRTIRLEDVKHIRAMKSQPGFVALDENGKSLFAVYATCSGYMPLADMISPYIDNEWEIPRFRGVSSTGGNDNVKNSVRIVIGVSACLAGFFLFQQVVNTNTSFEKVMVKTANEINQSCPIMVDSETRFDNVIVLPPSTFQYNYTLVNAEIEAIDLIVFENLIKPDLTNIVKTDPDLQAFRDNKITVNYHYIDKDGNELLTVSVTPEQYE